MWTDIQDYRGTDSNVKKYVFKSEDAIAEAVLYKYPTYEERTVMCISVQSGCPMGCSFCGTGKFFNRNLVPAEIVAQVQYMADHNDIDMNEVKNLQIMVMSMGEPLLNADGVSRAFDILHKDMPDAKLLISTSAPKTTMGWEIIMDCAARIPMVGLQFSVHESLDLARDRLIPMKAKLTLAEIAEKGLEFHELTGRSPFFNYCVHEDNNKELDVVRLEKLFDPDIWQATLSVICEADQSMSNAIDEKAVMVTEFSNMLLAKGFSTRVFNPAGQDDIGGGCGQLWQVQKWAAENPDLMRQSPGDLCRERAS